VAQLIAAAQANNPQTVIAIVSDHGFAPISRSVNLAIPFLEAGLVKTGKPSGLAGMMGSATTVTEWQAEPWMAGGMAAVILHDPSDQKVREQVRLILDKLAGDPANGIARILTEEEIRKYSGFPNAAFVIALKPGYVTGSALSGPLVTDTPGKGTHGYLSDFPEMRASFFVMGPEIARGKDLGVVDMRQIAPTIAGILGAALPTAKEPPLAVEAK
jgi:predicted AlkP superfamily pyrophosphatase or phosphodiesterase